MSKKKPAAQVASQRRVAAYIRVSTQRQATEGDSLEAQENAIRREVDHRSAIGTWDVSDIEFFVDAGRSAKDQRRPQPQRLRAAIAAGSINTVVVVKLDRITRSISDFTELMEFFKTHQVDFISLKETMDTSTAMGRAMLAIIMVFAQLERETTGERTRATMEDRVERGLWNGGLVYGYQVDADGRLAPDPAWAEIIQREFFDAVERLGSAGKVQRALRTKGIKTPLHTSRSNQMVGGTWFSKQQVIRVLRNTIYIGRISWGELAKEGCHPPIISAEQFERVQRLLEVTTARRVNAKHTRGRGYALRGLVRCRCGAMMTPKGAIGRGGKYHYYACTRQTHLGPTECAVCGIPAESLEEAVIARIAQIGTSEAARGQIIAKAMAMIDSDAQSAEREALQIRTQLATVKADIARLVAVLRRMGPDAVGSVGEELTALEQERKLYEARLEQLRERAVPLDQTASLAKNFIKNWSGLGELLAAADGDQKHAIVRHFVEVIELHSNDPSGKEGTYLLRLFPEAQLAGNAGVKTARQNENGGSVLTEPPLVRQVDDSAPPVGLEPTTKRLTVACSTN